MAVVYPKYGEEAKVAQRLLALADNVQDVKTSTDNGLAFLVPEDLYERYLAVDAVVEDEAVPTDPDQVKRRPGRPRKVVPAAPKEGD
jgi:hypothetical protein